MNNIVDHRNLYRDDEKPRPGLRIARVVTTFPDKVTLVLEGGKFALMSSVFEIPVSCYPLIKDDRFLVFPMLNLGPSTRYGIINKLNGAQAMGTMQGASSCLIDGMEAAYSGNDLILPTGALQSGDRVTVTPTWSGNQVKYIICKI